MSDLRTLYQSLILDHGKNPRNRRPMHDCGTDAPCQCREGFNPLCGDKLKLYARASGDVIEDLSFEGEGCAIFTASSSMLTEVLKGRSIEEIRAMLRVNEVDPFFQDVPYAGAVPPAGADRRGAARRSSSRRRPAAVRGAGRRPPGCAPGPGRGARPESRRDAPARPWSRPAPG